ncbi:hypothetical protein [Rathayibacter soli]|uniref:hypothetical protein n=1 Tax=Rathayibacter soli TaxID=3144168 RepID=UPI0027E4F54D|nr:hypothetical protein [Glaciibacter superstes]
MRKHTRILTAIGVVAASVLATIGTAAAANAAPVETGVSTSAHTTEHVVVDAWGVTLAPGRDKPIPRMICPVGAPYLVNKPYSAGRAVPNGVEVIESGFGMGVLIPRMYAPGNHFAQGAGEYAASATNWNPFTPQTVLFKLHCTSDSGESYWVADSMRDQ